MPAIVAGLAIAAFASASHVDPVPGPGNPQENSCPDGTVGFKVDPVTSGTKTDGALSVGITTHTTAAGPTFDFTSNLPIAVAFVKGGTVSNRYDYSPSVKADDGLHSPVNPMNGTYFGLSHLIFCYQPTLEISKTASASYTRTFEWDIDKSVTPNEWNLSTGGSGTSGYTVDVTRTGFTDSNWAVSGTITITNPMDVPATVELVADEVSDVGGDIPMDVDCPVTLPHVLVPDATLVCTYSGPLPDGTDRINAAIIKAEGVPGGVATAPVDFADPTSVVNGTVNVNDTNGMSWQFSNSGSRTYTRTFDCDDQGTHPNTATIVETGQSDSASVSVTCVPPPQPAIDLVIVKTATSPTPLNGTVNYSLSVSNKGPNTATNVQVADPAPAGISYQTAAPSQGTCVVTSALVTCNLGTVNVGQTVTIAITARATSVGTHINTATVTGAGGPETNPADNTDTAQTVVPQPLQPPTPKPKLKPKPKPAATVCLSLTANPKTIPADGRPDRLRVVVKTSRKNERGIKVVVRGAGVNKSGRTDSKGVALITVNPRNPGLITITAMEKNRRVCGARRIGVVGVFAPPLTG